jgi:hypothetical protein
LACEVGSNVKRAGKLSKTAERKRTIGILHTPPPFEEEHGNDDLGLDYPNKLGQKAVAAPAIFQMENMEPHVEGNIFRDPVAANAGIENEDLEFDLEAELEQALDKGELGGPSSESEEE